MGVLVATVFNSQNCGVFVFFFFFQAEDGIRDLTVTGVQTCALPISSEPKRPLGRVPSSAPGLRPSAPVVSLSVAATHHLRPRLSFRARCPSGRSSPRSEERRVGKECRSRWSTYD